MSTPLFEVDLPDRGFYFAPTELQPLLDWIDQEINFWAWIPADSGSWRSRLDRGRKALRGARSSTEQAFAAHLASSERQDHLLKVRHALVSAFKEYRLPHSESQEGLWLTKVHATLGARIASAAAAALGSQEQDPVPMDQAAYTSGWLLGMQHVVDRDASDKELGKLAAAAKKLNQLSSKTERQMTEYAGHLADEKARADSLLHSLALTADRHSEQLAALEAERSVKLESWDADLKEAAQQGQTRFDEAIAQMQQVMNGHLALRAPVSYWHAKQKSHLSSMLGWGLASAAALLGSAAALGAVAHLLFGSIAKNEPVAVWRFSVFAIGAVLAIWLCRVLVRLFLSHVHLHADASERVVMAKTYLALLRGDRLKDESQRSLILTALFRPASDGLVKDEGLPPFVAEWMTRTK